MKKAGIIKDKTFLLHRPDQTHAENPERLIAINQMLESEDLLKDLNLLNPRYASFEDIELIHAPHYIKKIEETSRSEFSQLDGDTYACRDTHKCALLAAGSVIELVEKTNMGEISSGFAFVRPPGHHAEKDRAMGFCIFNNIAIAAKYALKKLGLKKIAIVDFDIHHGNGTQNSFYDSDEVLFISSHQYPHYPGTGSLLESGSGRGEGYTVNIPVPVGFSDAEYFKIYAEVVSPIIEEYNPDMILSSAGFDIFQGDPLGGIQITGEGFSAIGNNLRSTADKVCEGKIVYTLEGGYSHRGLQEGVLRIMRSLMESSSTTVIKNEVSEIGSSVIEKIRSHHRNYWNI